MAFTSSAYSTIMLLISAHRRVQVSHRGKYSVERLIALQEYSQSTSTLHAAQVLLLTPLPMLVIALTLEAVPLNNPSEGWKANSGMWIRTALAVLVAVSTIFNLMRQLVPGVSIRPIHILSMSVIASIGYTATAIAMAALWVYPIPFTIIVMNGPVSIILGASYVTVVHRCSIRRVRSLNVDMRMFVRFVWFFGAQVLLSVVYPAYSVAFVRLASEGYEMAGLLILPVIRIVMRNLMAFCTSHLEDIIPIAAIFTVELFNALYLAAAVQRVSSIYVVLVIGAIDLVQLLCALYALHHDTSSLSTPSVPSDATREVEMSLPSVLFDAVNRATATISRTSTMEQFFHIRLRSGVKHTLSKGGRQRLVGMSQVGTFATSSLTRDRSKLILDTTKPSGRRFKAICDPTISPGRTMMGLVPSSRVAPTPEDIRPLGLAVINENSLVLAVPMSRPADVSQFETASPTELLQQLDRSLQVAFTIEYTALSEYLEFVMPLLYAIYVLLVVRLPSKAYHMELTGITTTTLARSINNTFIYGLIETLLFVLLTVLLRRGVRLNALHVVAFVLETHMGFVQGMLVMWMLITQEFQVKHWGTDFSFEFAWIREARDYSPPS